MLPSDIKQFEQYLTSRNLAPNTIQVYLYSVKQFYQMYHRLTSANLQKYKIQLMDQYKPQTVNLRIRALNSFLEQKDSSIPPLTMVRIQQKTFLDKIISEADYEYLIRRLYEDEEFTYYYLVRLITTTGVRVSEVVMFQVEDVYTGQKDIYSKGNKMRRIYIPTVLKQALMDWTASENRHKGALFLNRYRDPLSPCGIRSQLKMFSARYALNPDVMYPHSFRHRFAKNFIEKCGDIALLSDILGHESIETTRIYLRRSSTEQYAIINKVVNW